MYLLYGVAIMSLSAIVFRLLYVGTRLPETPWWAGEGLSHALVIAIIGILALGVGLLMNAIGEWRQHLFAPVEMSGVLAVLLIDWLIWVLAGRMLSAVAGTPVAPAPQQASAPTVSTPASQRKAA